MSKIKDIVIDILNDLPPEDRISSDDAQDQ
jgi:hypothetical protein